MGPNRGQERLMLHVRAGKRTLGTHLYGTSVVMIRKTVGHACDQRWITLLSAFRFN
jgi:hypothetical protein